MPGAHHDEPVASENRPPGSRIGLLSTEEHFVLETPRRGLHGAAMGELVGGMLVLVICAQWTGRTLVGTGAGAAAVSIPFWLLGLAVVGRALYAMLKHQRVDLRSDAGWIRLFPLGWRWPLRPGTLAVRFDHVTRVKAMAAAGPKCRFLCSMTACAVFESSKDSQMRNADGSGPN
jgi:hypothetical protein